MILFVWQGDGVLSDWTNGMIVALAPDLETALKAIKKECDYGMDCFPNDKPTEVINLGECSTNPRPRAWYVWGGG
jgi:hypothetical protein